MQPSPRILGTLAAGLVAIAGGAVVGTVPPMSQRGWHTGLPEAGVGDIARAQPVLAYPDHYPLVTQEGRFEVGELSQRGLYSNARYRDYYAYDYAYAEPEEVPYEQAYADAAEPAEQSAVAVGQDGVITIPDPEPAAEAAAIPPAPTVAAAGPRIIDVAAELAARESAGS